MGIGGAAKRKDKAKEDKATAEGGGAPAAAAAAPAVAAVEEKKVAVEEREVVMAIHEHGTLPVQELVARFAKRVITKADKENLMELVRNVADMATAEDGTKSVVLKNSTLEQYSTDFDLSLRAEPPPEAAERRAVPRHTEAAEAAEAARVQAAELEQVVTKIVAQVPADGSIEPEQARRLTCWPTRANGGCTTPARATPPRILLMTAPSLSMR